MHNEKLFASPGDSEDQGHSGKDHLASKIDQFRVTKIGIIMSDFRRNLSVILLSN